MESREDFEARMAQVIWDNRWKKESAYEVFTKSHMCVEGARVYALEHCVFAANFPRWLSNITGNCPHLEVRKYLIENTFVEEVRDPTIVTGHYESLVDFAVELGADRAINYRSSDFVAEVLKLTDGRGVNVVLDMVAGDYVQREIQCLADDGRLAIIATLGGLSGEVPFSQMMRKRLTITGSTLRPRPVTFKRDIAAKLQQHIWPLLASGRIKPVIYQRFPLADAPAAHALMESSQHIGKILLTC